MLCSTHAETVTYDEHIRPLFKQHCLNCHNPDKKKADLDLSSMAGVIAGGSGGVVVKPGVPDSSLLFMAIVHDETVEAMPPKKPRLPESTIQLMRDWILQGLVERTGGESKLRKVEFDISDVAEVEADGPPPMPEFLSASTNDLSIRLPVIRALAASPTAPLIAVAGSEEVLFYHPEDMITLGSVPFPEGTIYDLKFSRNGTLLLVAGGRGAHSGKVILIDVRTGNRVTEIGDEEDVVLSADISSDHRFVAFGTPNKFLKIYSTQTGKLLHRIDKHTDWVTSVAFHSESDWIASGDRNGGIHVWEAEKGAIVYSLSDHRQCITDLSWRPDGKMLGSVADDGKLVLWDMEDGWPAKVIDAHKSKALNRYTRGTGVLSLHWSNAGQMVTCGRDRRVKLWNVDGSRLKEWQPLDVLPTSVQLVGQSSHIFVGGFDGRLRFSSILSSGEMMPIEF